MNKNNIVKKTWNELTPYQQSEFVRQMKFAGWRDEAEYPSFIYQIKDGDVCHGWIDKGFARNLFHEKK